jgi:hypothetical protein
MWRFLPAGHRGFRYHTFVNRSRRTEHRRWLLAQESFAAGRAITSQSRAPPKRHVAEAKKSRMDLRMLVEQLLAHKQEPKSKSKAA